MHYHVHNNHGFRWICVGYEHAYVVVIPALDGGIKTVSKEIFGHNQSSS